MAIIILYKPDDMVSLARATAHSESQESEREIKSLEIILASISTSLK